MGDEPLTPNGTPPAASRPGTRSPRPSTAFVQAARYAARHHRPDVDGLLFIGDPHLESRVPGFRRDDYPQVALQKFRWCLQYAQEQNLQPILLGDLFQLPQDNPNWLISAIVESIAAPLPAIYGNHDVRENGLRENDSINILFNTGHLWLLSGDDPWRGTVGGATAIVGGTPWGQPLPKSFDRTTHRAELVAWATHHNIHIPGFEEATGIRPKEIPGIDLVVNGHIHRRLREVTRGSTHWVTPGNITRRSRSDASREHQPAVMVLRRVPAVDAAATADATGRITDPMLPFPPAPGEKVPEGRMRGSSPATENLPHNIPFTFQTANAEWQADWMRVPHEAFDDVFHEAIEVAPDEIGGSGFIADLRELTARRTDTGAGLLQYLKNNVRQFDPPIAEAILRLAEEVTSGKEETR